MQTGKVKFHTRGGLPLVWNFFWAMPAGFPNSVVVDNPYNSCVNTQIRKQAGLNCFTF